MLCKEYMELSPKERIDFIGKLVHLSQNSTFMHNECKTLIDMCKRMGLLNGIEIHPQQNKENE